VTTPASVRALRVAGRSTEEIIRDYKPEVIAAASGPGASNQHRSLPDAKM
jgi:hypothetical protein